MSSDKEEYDSKDLINHKREMRLNEQKYARKNKQLELYNYDNEEELNEHLQRVEM